MTSAAGVALRSRSFSYCSWTCIASSRVGTRISAETCRCGSSSGQAFDHRDQKGQRLAGAGLCRGQYVFTFQRGRYRGRLNRRRGSEMELCQLLLESSRQGHIFELCQNDFFFLGEASREEVRRYQVSEGVLARSRSDRWRASREDTTEAALILFGAENETEAGKAGNRIELRIGCRLQAAVANSVYLGLYHSGLQNVADAPTATSHYLPKS